MKKITLALAAIAMIAFAGCKKENNGFVADQNGMVTFRASGENFMNADKQTYDGFMNRIMFDNGDQAYFNGQETAINCYDPLAADPEAPVANSYYGTLTVPGSLVLSDNVILYPSSLYTAGTAADYSDWTVTMWDEVDLLPSGEYEVAMPGLYQSWPMAAHTTGNQFVMKNAVALLAPAVKYGYSFVAAAALAGNFNNEPFTRTDLPELKLTKVVVNSSDAILTGNGHLNGATTATPYIVMDNDDMAGHQVVATPIDMYNPAIPAGGSAEYIMGNIPCAPIALHKHLQVNYYFTLTFTYTPAEATTPTTVTYYVKYQGADVELTGGQLSVERSMRTTMICNLFDGSPAHMEQTTIQTTDRKSVV